MKAKILRADREKGDITIPSSKSYAHRLLIAAALAKGASRIAKLDLNDDILSTMDCLRLLGAKIDLFNDEAVVFGMKDLNQYQGELVDCRESGSTLRFLLPLFVQGGKTARFTGKGKLLQRPESVYEALYSHFEKKEDCIEVSGPLKPGHFRIAGNISSQFVTGLLYLLPLLDGDSTLEIIPPVESKPYIDMTLDVLSDSGIRFTREGFMIHVEGNQEYEPIDQNVIGDDSQAAFYVGESLLLQKEMDLHNVIHESLQGDHEIFDIARMFHADVRTISDGYKIVPADKLQARTIDIMDCPDLGPMIIALCTQAEGISQIIHAKRLRIKESDRIRSMEEELCKLGCIIFSDENNVYVEGPVKIKGGVELSGHNDHRIIMSLAILATIAEEPVVIDGAEAVSKSYPDFFEDLKLTGVEVELYD